MNKLFITTQKLFILKKFLSHVKKLKYLSKKSNISFFNIIPHVEKRNQKKYY